jgi:hypothetical protein
LHVEGDGNAVPPHLAIVKRNGDLVDLKTVASIGEDWTGARLRPRKEDSHPYPIVTQVARAITADA